MERRKDSASSWTITSIFGREFSVKSVTAQICKSSEDETLYVFILVDHQIHCFSSVLNASLSFSDFSLVEEPIFPPTPIYGKICSKIDERFRFIELTLPLQPTGLLFARFDSELKTIQTFQHCTTHPIICAEWCFTNSVQILALVDDLDSKIDEDGYAENGNKLEEWILDTVSHLYIFI